jgi:phosphate transport system substrate-binding protein
MIRAPERKSSALPDRAASRCTRLIALCAAAVWVSHASAASREQIVVVGSSTVYPFSGIVAEHFAKSGPFHMPAIRTDTPDINDASRPMSAGERTVCAANGVKKITEIRIGYDSLIFARKATTPTFNVTLEQMWLAAAKVVPVNEAFVPNPYRRWHDISASLPDQPIQLFGPAAGHGTRDAFIELVMQPSCAASLAGSKLGPSERDASCGGIRNDGRWIDVENLELTLGKLAGNPDAIGVLTYSYLEQFPSRIHASTVAGVAPSRASIRSGAYPISRPLYIYLKESHLETTTGLADYASEFVSFCAAGANGYLSDEGLVPLPMPELLLQRGVVARLQR